MSGHRHRHSHASHSSSHAPHARRHHRHAKAAVTGATVAGAGVASAPFFSEQAGQLAEEALGYVPKPMLAGLAVGVMVGAPLGYLWHARQTPPVEGQAERITTRREAETTVGQSR